ncbi:MAG: hypothetical protein KDD94_10325 [Calditrichaeota bacterium]|nr:hypothetical protein [Calditrichota bacterium]
MHLLVFAHRGEAQVFLSELKAKAVQGFNDLYQSEEDLILICGEGSQQAAIASATIISVYQQELDLVINYGIAGALSKQLKKSIYEVRTVYAEQRSSLVEFKSYTSASDGKIDCISSVDRVITDQQSSYLHSFADLVDRELWGIASACHYLDKPFKAFKLVSDFAGSETSCFDIKHQAIDFSQQLFEYHQSNGRKIPEHKEPDMNLPDGFYTTVSQQRTIKSLLTKLALKRKSDSQEILADIEISKLLSEDISPKKRSARLINYLTEQLNPFNRIINSNLNQSLEPLLKAGVNVSFDENLENPEIRFQGSIVNQRQLEKLRTGFNLFDLDDFNNVLNGTLDVR